MSSARDLADHLEGASPAAAYVAVRTWLHDHVGTADLETLLDRRPSGTVLPVGLEACATALRRASADDGVLLAADLLRSLDRSLVGPPAASFPGFPAGSRWMVRPRGRGLAIRRFTWQGAQSLSLHRIAPRHVVLRTDPVAGRTVRAVPAEQWLGRAARLRLAGNEPVRVLLWPFAPGVAYAVRERDGGAWVSVLGLGGVEAEIDALLDLAAEERVAIVVLPELALDEAALAALRGALAARRREWPALVVAGLAHAPGDGTDLDVNEAVVLDGTGREVHRHRKLCAFEAHGVAERLRRGTEVAVLESPLGHLCALVCMDLFNGAVRSVVEQTHATVLLVPSLSPKITAHVDGARQLQVALQASTFCCNRTLDGAPPDAHRGSFYRIAGEEPVFHEGDLACLLFEPG